MNKSDWVVGRKYRFIGGESPSGYFTDLWTIGNFYEMVEDANWYEGENVPDARFTTNDPDNDSYLDLCCFEPVSPSLYVVGMQRKSDGKIFLSDRKDNVTPDLENARGRVEHAAQFNSSDYVYFVYELVPVMSAELDSPPVKKNWFK